MKHLFDLNHSPYGTERSDNGLRLALVLRRQDTDAEITVFLMADAVACAKADLAAAMAGADKALVF